MIETNAHTRNAMSQLVTDRLHWIGQRGRIVAVKASHRFIHDRRVGNSPCHRPDMIHRPSQGENAIPTNSSIGRLKANATVDGRGIAD